MKTTSFKNNIVAVLLLVIAGHAGFASAFSMVGSKTMIRNTAVVTPPPSTPPPPVTTEFLHSGTLTEPAWVTDVWTVDCPATTVRLDAQVIDKNSPVATPLLSVQAINIRGGKEKAANSTDPGNGDEAPSPLVSITDSAGRLFVLIDKTSAGSKIYTVNIACKNVAGEALAGTKATLTQDDN
jgi:hypothetical protein